jgi:hypothetical protein
MNEETLRKGLEAASTKGGSMRSKLWIGILALGFGMATGAGAQEADEERVLEPGKWYPGLEVGLNLSESSYSNNWAGGDKGSVVWTFILNGDLENQLSPRVNWSNQLKLAFGQTHQQSVDAGGERSWDRPEKSTDLIDLETLFRFTLGGWADPYLSGTFESQFQDASDPDGRTLALNPLKFKESVGVSRLFVDTEERRFLTRLGFTVRQGIRKQFAEAAPSTETVSESEVDGGLELVADYKARVLQDRVTWTSKLSVLKPFFYSGKSDLEGLSAGDLQAAGLDPDVAAYTTAFDLDWENIFSSQITRIISVNLYLKWVYDKYDNSVVPILDNGGMLSNPEAVGGAIRKAGQFKQTLALGFTYRI